MSSATPASRTRSTPWPLPAAEERVTDAFARLPAPLTPLVGRRLEVEAAATMLRQGARLLTLTGPGGVGKTRLAIEVAASVAGAFPDGVAFVELAPVRNPSLVATAVGQAMGFGAWDQLLAGAGPVAVLRDSKDHLLVLDNFEHVLDAAPFVAELLAACPGLRVLTTSRIPLRISGERLLLVMPLGLPDAAAGDQDGPSLEAVGASEAVALFVQRARAVAPGFVLAETNAEVVAEICRRLDGLPLALELAAVRTRVLSPAALLARMERRLPLIAEGSRDQPDRLRTMDDAITWSHDLLCPAEQILFRRLAVFSGGFTLEAAVVVGRNPEDTAVGNEASLIDTLEALIDQGMVMATGQTRAGMAKPRFRMLETVREYAVERLAEGGDEASMRAAHAEYYLRWVEEIAPDLMEGRHLAALLDGLEGEHANLQVALEHLIETGNANASARLAGGLAPFWLFHSHRGEGRRWLDRVMELGQEMSVPPAVWVRVVGGAAVLAFAQADYGPAEALAKAELALWDELGDRWGGATALNLLGAVARAQGAFDQAAERCEDALGRFREAGDPARVALSQCNLGILAYWRGDFERATTLLEEAIDSYAEAGDLFAYGIAVALSDLGLVSCDRGDHARAASLFAESLGHWRVVGTREGLVDWLTRVATLAVAVAQPQHAPRLFGAAEAVSETIGYALEGPERTRHGRAMATARRALGDLDFARLWEEGRELSAAQAVEQAGPLLAALATTSAVTTGKAAPGALTKRERDILRLVVEGRTDKAIADQLQISHRTASRHVARVLAKLGVASRAEAAAVVRSGLV